MTPLNEKHCRPCEGGVPSLDAAESERLIAEIPAWSITPDGLCIERKWRLKSFVDCVKAIDQIASLAEQEQHHPDFHLTGYRNLRIVLTTHAIGGLSENDFILAAKIDSQMDGHGVQNS